jgi:Ser/Thr protein kinase RdoA (MazF antagonist)
VDEKLAVFGALPDWLVAITDTERVRLALERAVPDLSSGVQHLGSCVLQRARLKKDSWTVSYRLALEAPAREALVEGRLYPPGVAVPDGSVAAPGQPIGAPEWSCYLPELRLSLSTPSAEKWLPAMRSLTDPVAAMPMLERWQRATWPDLRLRACAPNVLRYVPGNRCSILFELDYEVPGNADWPRRVVAKVHRRNEGANAFAAMRALQEARVSGGIVDLAEPLAYDPELRVLLQRGLAAECTLMDCLRGHLAGGHQVVAYLETTAAGLAELHRSGVEYGELATWSDKLRRTRLVVDRLGRHLPDLQAPAVSLLTRLEGLAERHPPQPAGPAHRAFRPAQVLIGGARVAFIDFDAFGQAEPAMDVAEFRATIKGDAYSAAGPERVDALDAVANSFLRAYGACAPISEQRVALWESLALLTNTLDAWTKVRPSRAAGAVDMLQRQFETVVSPS